MRLNCVCLFFQQFDFDTMTDKMVQISEWSENAITSINNIIDDATTVRFIAQEEIADTEHLFGTLEIVVESGVVFRAIDVLLDIYQTIETSTFFDGECFFVLIIWYEIYQLLNSRKAEGFSACRCSQSSHLEKCEFHRGKRCKLLSMHSNVIEKVLH